MMRSSNRPPPLIPRAFRKRLSSQRLTEISLIHHANLEALLQGGRQALLNYASSVWTWRNVADRLGIGQAEIAPQLALVEQFLERFSAQGCLVLGDEEYRCVRDGVIVMDLIAAEADMATTAWAAERSTAELCRRCLGPMRS